MRLRRRIPRSRWRWYGMPGHLIVSSSCCFHMVTDIGQVRVSTIGCYHRCPESERNYETRIPVGAGEDLYETFVFPIDDLPAESPATQPPLVDWLEIDSERYPEEVDAEAGHMRMCEKWAKLGGDPTKSRDYGIAYG